MPDPIGRTWLTPREQAVLLAAADATDRSPLQRRGDSERLVADFLGDPNYEAGNAVIDVAEAILADRLGPAPAPAERLDDLSWGAVAIALVAIIFIAAVLGYAAAYAAGA